MWFLCVHAVYCWEFTNKYSFILKGQPITLVPLTPKQVREDQLKLQRSNENKKGRPKLKKKTLIKVKRNIEYRVLWPY
jgi:hypothetical protein